MGLTHSQADFFRDASQVDGDQIDVYTYLQRAERSLWREEPWWHRVLQSGGTNHDTSEQSGAVTAAAAAGAHKNDDNALGPSNPAKPLTFHEALAAVPKLMHDGWVAPLVALIESADNVVQSVALALLAKIVQTPTAESIFINVGGIDKLMALLDLDGANVQYLTLEVIYALCSHNPTIVLQFCTLGLVRHLAALMKSNAPELVLTALKILRLTLQQPAVKAEMTRSAMLTVLMERIASPHTAIAKASIICIGLSLPNAENLVEIVRLGCIDAFLSLMVPTNPNAAAVLFALSLIADEHDALLPRDRTLATTCAMLETLRGAAKRSTNASAMGYLIAALAPSPLFYAALCSEANLSIMSKLLVGGSTDVLCATAYALGVVATHARDTNVRELLFRVDAPANLIELLATPSVSAHVQRLAIYALACLLQDAVAFGASSRTVALDLTHPESLRRNIVSCVQTLLRSPALVDCIYNNAIEQLATGSTYATTLLVCLSVVDNDAMQRKCCNVECIQRMLAYSRAASARFVPTCVAFFIACTTPPPVASGQAFCRCVVACSDDYVALAIALFDAHAPDSLLGLPVLLRHFVACASDMKAALSVRIVIDPVLNVVTRCSNAALHEQVLQFLVALTQDKNDAALRVLFATDPERVANLLHAHHVHIQLLAATLLRRMFKRLNAVEIPSIAAKRQLVKLLTNGVNNSSSSDASTAGKAAVLAATHNRVTQRAVAVAAARVWGNLLQYNDKRAEFATLPHAFESLLLLLHACARECTSTLETSPATTTVLVDAAATHSSSNSSTMLQHLHKTIRTVHSALLHDDVKRVAVTSPHLLSVVDLFTHTDARVVRLAIQSLLEIARLPALRRHVAVAPVLSAVHAILCDHDATSDSCAVARVDALQLVSVLSKKDVYMQQLLLEYKIVDAAVLLLHSPLATIDSDVHCALLPQCFNTLAWTASGATSPVRSVLATTKLVDLTLRHTDALQPHAKRAALHLLQRLSLDAVVQDLVRAASGPGIIMRALSDCSDIDTKRRACTLIANLVAQHDANRAQIQRLGAISYLVTLVAQAALDASTLKLRIHALRAIAAMATGDSAVAKASKLEVLECEDARPLVQLVASGTDGNDPRLCAAWCYALAMAAANAPSNQRKLVDAGSAIVELLVTFVGCDASAPLRVNAAQLLAHLAAAPENRTTIVLDGGDLLLTALIDALASDDHALQQFAALTVANLATRNDDNKVRLGASGVVAPLVDRLSSKHRDVLEPVLSAVTKLGSHAGNKVKFGSKVCFAKLLALVHDDALAIRKSAVSAVAVLLEGSDSNKKCLLQCDASVVTALCALMKSTNGKVVESAMLILGELALLPDQTLAISKSIDAVVLVHMIEHVNRKIKCAALTTLLHLTKESFNKARFGIAECVAALLQCCVTTADDVSNVELAIGCLANLSFTTANAQQLANTKALTTLLWLAAASMSGTTDYLTPLEVRSVRLADATANAAALSSLSLIQQAENTTTSNGVVARVDDDSNTNDVDIHALDSEQHAPLDFSACPSRQTAVLEQTLLVLSNCADAYKAQALVTSAGVKIVCQALQHDTSDLAKRCACFVVATWCKQDGAHQATATQTHILPALVQLLHAPAVAIVEAALYALCKLSSYSDNHLRLLQLDVLATLTQHLLRKPSHLAHPGVLDRALRLLGTLATFPKVRHVAKSEEIVSDVLTPLLQLHRDALAKNSSRLIVALLDEESLKFFMPKKTVMLLRTVFTDPTTNAKTIRNVLRIFCVLALVEEHKMTIALEDSGETLGRMVRELDTAAVETADDGVTRSLEQQHCRASRNADAILPLLASIANTKRIASTLVDKQLCAVLPRYLVPFECDQHNGDDLQSDVTLASREKLRCLEQNVFAVVVAKHLCASPQSSAIVAELSQLECTALLLALVRLSVTLMPTRLTQLSFECLVVLERLCDINAATSRLHDQRVLFHANAVDVVAVLLTLWLDTVADGDRRTPPVLQCTCAALEAVAPLAFVAPLVHVLRNLASDVDNRNALVARNCMRLLLQTMNVSTLSPVLRQCCLTTFATLSELPIAFDCIDQIDHVALLMRFLLAHECDAALLLDALRAFATIVERSRPSRQRVLAHAAALPFLLTCLGDANSKAQQENSSNNHTVYAAMRALKCLATEQAAANSLAQIETVQRVPQLLLISIPIDQTDDSSNCCRVTQILATEFIGHMAFFGHATRLALDNPVIAHMLAFAAIDVDPRVTPVTINLALWSFTQLIKDAALAPRVCQCIVHDDDDKRINTLLACARLSSPLPQENEVASVVVSYALSILLCVVHTDDSIDRKATRVLVRKRIGTRLSVLLEAVEHDIRGAALQLLALLLPQYEADDDSSSTNRPSEEWPVILHHVVEWLEVYAHDPATCALGALHDAFVCLRVVVMRSSVDAAITSAFQSPAMLRTNVADIVAATLRYCNVQDDALVDDVDGVASTKQRVLLLALDVCRHLMKFSTTYTDRSLALDVPTTLESVLEMDDAQLQSATLACMNNMNDRHMVTRGDDDADSSVTVLFASHRCVTRLLALARDTTNDLALVASATPLLACIATALPKLLSLCCLDGVETAMQLASTHWSTQRSQCAVQVTDGSCTMLLAMFANDANVFALYDQADVIPRLFAIVEAFDAPELPLQVLATIAAFTMSHARFLPLLPAICKLLHGDDAVQLSGASMGWILSILRAIFCRFERHDDSNSDSADNRPSMMLQATLQAGKQAVLPQVLPLNRWTRVSNERSVETVLLLLLAYVSTPNYKTLLSDGANTLALLQLVGSTSIDVAVAAARVLLCASHERAMQISITVEDGIAVLVQVLQRTAHRPLQCLVLTTLRNMSADSEVQVLILNERGGAARLVEFLADNSDDAQHSAVDTRLALACEVLQQLSHTANAATQIVASGGHKRLIALNQQQRTRRQRNDSNDCNSDHQCTTTLDVLVNLAQCKIVVPQLLDAKLDALLLQYVLQQQPAQDSSDRSSSAAFASECTLLALAGLRSLCSASRDVRHTLGATRELVPLLEATLVLSERQCPASTDTDSTAASDALAVLQFISKTPEGRTSIVAATTVHFIERVCCCITSNATDERRSISNSSAVSTTASTGGATTRTNAVAVHGLKLLANVLADAAHAHWQLTALTTLTSLLGECVAMHQQPNYQRTALRVLSSAFAGGATSLDLSVTPQLLSDLLNVVLISASNDVAALAEDVVVSAFRDPQHVRSAIGSSQILEQLLIVVPQRHALGAALTQTLYVSIARHIVVTQRFVVKILSLLASLQVTNDSDAVDDDKVLVRALCVYVSFVYKSASLASAAQRDVGCELRRDTNAGAFASFTREVAQMHAGMCLKASSTSSVPLKTTTAATEVENQLLWCLFAACAAPSQPTAPHVQQVLEQRLGCGQWLCLVDDWFAVVMRSDVSDTSSNNNSNASDSVAAMQQCLSADDALLATLSVASTLTRLGGSTNDADDDAEALERRQLRIATRCLELLYTATVTLDHSHALIEAALTTLLDVRDHWRESCLLAACTAFPHMATLLRQLLTVFDAPTCEWNRSRHLILHLFLTLVSTGHFIDELKASDVVRAIEHNDRIDAADKALPLTILSLLGYNSDLNSEFALALDRCVDATPATTNVSDPFAYVVDFLQLYALTDEALQQRAISVFMHELVAITTASAAALDSEADDDSARALYAKRSQLCVAGLRKLAHVRKFVDLYLHEWQLDALLSVAFARERGDAANDFQARAQLPRSEISTLLDLAARIYHRLGPLQTSTQSTELGSESTIVNALMLVQSLSDVEVPLLEQVLALLAWVLPDAASFSVVCRHASMLNAFVAHLFRLSDSAATTLLDVLETVIRFASRIEALTALLETLLDVVYTHAVLLATTVRHPMRDKLLLFVLLLLKRFGGEGFAASDAYEASMQRILHNIRARTTVEARVSWSLLGMLTEFDTAIITLFNLDGVTLLLRELCVHDTKHRPASRSSQQKERENPLGAFQMDALKCLSKAARTHDEVLLKIAAADNIDAVLFAVLADAAAMIAVCAGRNDDTASAVDVGEAQMHAAHVIARIASHETLRASLVTPEHVDVLIDALESVHLAVVLSALEALHWLCDVALCLDALVRHATVPVLGQILSSPLVAVDSTTQHATETFVLGILGSMCAKSKLSCRRVVSSNLVPKVNAFLRTAAAVSTPSSSPDFSVQHSAVWIVQSLSKDAELVPKLRDHGVVDTLTHELGALDPRTTQCRAFSALANIIKRSRVSIVIADAVLARAVVHETVDAISRNVPLSFAQRAIAKGLRVFEALAGLDAAAKTLLVDEQAVQLTLALLGPTYDEQIQFRAMRVATRYASDNHDAQQIRTLFDDDSVLINVVRAVSASLSDRLLVALTLLLALLHDDVLNDKLTTMTYDVLLRLLQTQTTTTLSAMQTNALATTLQCLVVMTTTSTSTSSNSSISDDTVTTAVCAITQSATEIASSIAPLVMLLQPTMTNDSIRLHALHLLVTFAATVEWRNRMLQSGMLTALVALLLPSATDQQCDDKHVQLCLLGMALLTTASTITAGDGGDGNEIAIHVAALADESASIVRTLVELLTSRDPHVQANAVWVLANIAIDARLRTEIVALGGATTLQAIWNETISNSDSDSMVVATTTPTRESRSSSSVRPTTSSSSMRIREYAPKAIRSLGFAP